MSDGYVGVSDINNLGLVLSSDINNLGLVKLVSICKLRTRLWTYIVLFVVTWG